MLERSPLAENALQCLHDEDYGRPYDTRTLNSSTMIFSGGRSGISLDGDWNFCVDLLDTGLRQKGFAMEPMAAEERAEPWDYDAQREAKREAEDILCEAEVRQAEEWMRRGACFSVAKS